MGSGPRMGRTGSALSCDGLPAGQDQRGSCSVQSSDHITAQVSLPEHRSPKQGLGTCASTSWPEPRGAGEGLAWMGAGGGYRKTVHPRTGAKRHPRVCWSVCPEGNTNTGASPSRPCIQMSGVDSGLPQSAGLGCRVWEPQAGWGRVHTAWGKAPWRRGGSVGSPKVGGIGVEGDVCSRGEPRAMVKQARSPSGDLEAPPRGQRAERAGEAGPEQPCCSAPPLPHAGLL